MRTEKDRINNLIFIQIVPVRTQTNSLLYGILRKNDPDTLTLARFLNLAYVSGTCGFYYNAEKITPYEIECKIFRFNL